MAELRVKAESRTRAERLLCPICPGGPMHLAVTMKEMTVFVCEGCGASLSVCTEKLERRKLEPGQSASPRSP